MTEVVINLAAALRKRQELGLFKLCDTTLHVPADTPPSSVAEEV